MSEEALDGDDLGRGSLEEGGEVAVEFIESLGERGVGSREAEDAGLDDEGAYRAGLDAGVAGDAEAGVDAKDAHGGEYRRSWDAGGSGAGHLN